MLSIRRLAVTATAVAALAAPAAAQARPDLANGQRTFGTSVDKVSPDARYGVPEGDSRFISVPKPEVVQADSGFDWGDAAVGGGAAILLTVALGGAALTVRPRRASAQH
jgi:hypothetical protein